MHFPKAVTLDLEIIEAEALNASFSPLVLEMDI